MNALPVSAAPDERARLLAMIDANWMTQAIGTAATLGLPVLPAQGAQDSACLAAATCTDEPSLKRLLQGLPAALPPGVAPPPVVLAPLSPAGAQP